MQDEDKIKSLFDEMQKLEKRVTNVGERFHGLNKRIIRWGIGVFLVALLIVLVIGAVAVGFIVAKM